MDWPHNQMGLIILSEPRLNSLTHPVTGIMEQLRLPFTWVSPLLYDEGRPEHRSPTDKTAPRERMQRAESRAHPFPSSKLNYLTHSFSSGRRVKRKKEETGMILRKISSCSLSKKKKK